MRIIFKFILPNLHEKPQDTKILNFLRVMFKLTILNFPANTNCFEIYLTILDTKIIYLNVFLKILSHVKYNDTSKYKNSLFPTRDRLVRSIPVEPEGYLREKTWSEYVCTEGMC